MSGDLVLPVPLPRAGAAHPATERRVRRERRRLSAGLAAAALLAGSVPAAASANETPGSVTEVPAAAPAASGPAFAYALSATATPARIEIFEQTIPIPVPGGQPQVELNLPYATAEAATGLATSRASYLWPGDNVGEGAKTFGEQLMLPPQLFENGYPLQVNASTTGEPSQADEPFPGTVQRATASPERATARAGFSPDGSVGDRGADGGEGDGGGDEGGAAGGLPGLPELPLDALGELGAALGGGASSIPLLPGRASAAVEEPPPNSPLPAEIASVVDLDGGVATVVLDTAGPGVSSTARSLLGDVALLGGVVVLEGVTGTVRITSDGGEPVAVGETTIGGISIAGQRFAFTQDGPEAGGQASPLPGLPDDPAAALEALGISLGTPEVTTETLEDGTLVARGTALRIGLDLGVAKQVLSALPLGMVIDAIPEEAAELKEALQTINALSPRFVVRLGNATASATILDPIAPVAPGTAGPPAGGGKGSGAAAGGGTGAGAGGGAAGGGAAAPGGAPAAGAAGGADGVPALEATPLGAGLPPLNTVPGALLFGGILGAIVAGSWLRRMGLVVLGGGAACGHGLETGVPDLRKA